MRRAHSAWYVCLVLVVATAVMVGCRRGTPGAGSPSSTAPWSTSPWSGTTSSWSGTEYAGSYLGELVPIEIELPTPVFRGTPVPVDEPNVEPPRKESRDPFLAPEGTINLALGKLATCSDPDPTSGEIDFVTDGDKEASDFGHLQMRPGTQWVQIDLGKRSTVFAVLVWHRHSEARVYRDVVVQLSDDPDFLEAVTVFNADHNNSSGLGIGGDMGYVETSEGRLIDCRGAEGRYVRLYSRGNHIDESNDCTEVEVYGIPSAGSSETSSSGLGA